MKSKKSEIEDIVGEARISLYGVELKALNQWKKRHFKKKANIHAVANFAMDFALIHPEQFDRWLDTVVNYCKAEDINQLAHLSGQIAARLLESKT